MFAQNGFYVPKTGKVFFIGDSSTIFSDVINRGNLGVGKKAYINFTGKKWENDPQAQINDDTNDGAGTTGIGGWIRFLSDTVRQQIVGGYNAAAISGPSFPRIIIENKAGVELQDGSTKVRNEFRFDKGYFYLHDQIMVVGNKNPGTISNYDSLHYFITGNKPGDGLLVRENISSQDSLITFPVGSRENAYTPAAIRANSRFSDDYFVSVFDSTRINGSTGTTMVNESVNKTWQMGKRFRPSFDPVDVLLQHLNSDEGSYFTQHRQYSFVSWYNGAIWDIDSARGTPAPGFLTTGSPLVNSGVNGRSFLAGVASNAYMTKLTGNAVLLKTRLWLNAYRLSSTHVNVFWRTLPEINVKSFIVQRRLANETDFSDAGNVLSHALNGYSITTLSYSMIDPNRYTGISFYRLKLVPYIGDTTYSDTVIVAPINGPDHILLWPNPTPDLFNISLYKTLPVKSIIIWNVLGQKLREEQVNGRTFIQMRGLLPGSYLVSFILKDGRVYETKKLIVEGSY